MAQQNILLKEFILKLLSYMPKLLDSLFLVSHRVFTEGVAGHQNTTTL